MKHNIEDINNMSFASDDIPVLGQKEAQQVSYRLTTAQVDCLPDSIDVEALRRKLAEIYETHLSGNLSKLEANCDIKRDTFQKLLRFQNGRNIRYNMLSKFCVGAKLPLSTAKELFALMGHNLTENNRADFILMCILENGDDISEYAEAMSKYCGTSVLSETDKLSARTYDDAL